MHASPLGCNSYIQCAPTMQSRTQSHPSFYIGPFYFRLDRYKMADGSGYETTHNVGGILYIRRIYDISIDSREQGLATQLAPPVLLYYFILCLPVVHPG